MLIDDRGPKHIGIILDGNRRWAKARGMKPTDVHKEGEKAVEKIVKYAYDCNLRYMTIYAFSTENWKRDKEEVSLLMNIFKNYLTDLLNRDFKKEIRIKIYGDISKLDKPLQLLIKQLEKKTEKYDKMTLGICINYGGRPEIVSAVRLLAEDIKNGKLNPEDITEETISNALYTKSIPDPDLIIRTSNEYRLSNFLTWQSSYSELYFPKDIMWPEFDEQQFDLAIEEYLKRNRRYGGN